MLKDVARRQDDIAWVSKRLQTHRQLSSSDSWGSEDFECYSSTEEDLHPLVVLREGEGEAAEGDKVGGSIRFYKVTKRRFCLLHIKINANFSSPQVQCLKIIF